MLQSGWAGIQALVDSSLKADAFKPYTVFLQRLPKASQVLSGQESACQCRRLKKHGFDPWLGRSPGRRNDNPLQYSCLENPLDREGWQVHGVTKNRTQLSN